MMLQLLFGGKLICNLIAYCKSVLQSTTVFKCSPSFWFMKHNSRGICTISAFYAFCSDRNNANQENPPHILSKQHALWWLYSKQTALAFHQLNQRIRIKKVDVYISCFVFGRNIRNNLGTCRSYRRTGGALGRPGSKPKKAGRRKKCSNTASKSSKCELLLFALLLYRSSSVSLFLRCTFTIYFLFFEKTNGVLYCWNHDAINVNFLT